MWFLLFVFVGARAVDGVGVCRPRCGVEGLVSRDCVTARLWSCVCYHSRATCIARFHVRLETDGWHGSALAREGVPTSWPILQRGIQSVAASPSLHPTSRWCCQKFTAVLEVRC